LDAQGTPDSMREAATQYSAQLLALPVFSSVAIPPHDNILAMYGMFVIQHHIPGDASVSSSSTGQPAAPVNSTTTMGFGFGGGGGMSSPISYGMQGGVLAANSFGAVSTGTVSVDDAFSDLGPTTNAPIPSLEEAASSLLATTPPNTTTASGEIELPPPASTGSVAEGSFPSGTTQDASIMALEAPTSMPASSDPSLFTPAPVTDTEQEEDDDDFGDFEDVASFSAPAVAVAHETLLSGPPPVSSFPSITTQGDAGSVSEDPFGAFGESSNQPLPSLGGGASSSVDPSITASQAAATDQDDFGGFSAAAPADGASSDQFVGSSLGQTAAPQQTMTAAPSFDGSMQSSTMAPMATNVPQTSSPPEQDDDFGGFAAAPASGQFGSLGQAPQQTMASPSFDGSMQSSTMDPTPTTTSAPISDVFGGLGVENAPLPSLEKFGSGNGDPIGTRAGNNDDDDDNDFGGFETATEPSNQESATLPSAISSSDPFSGLPETPNQPLPQWNVSTEIDAAAAAASDQNLGAQPSGEPIAHRIEDDTDADQNLGAQPSGEPIAHRIEDDTDDTFGGFETAATLAPTSESVGGDGQLGSFPEAPAVAPSFDGTIGSWVEGDYIAGSVVGMPAPMAEGDPFGDLSVQDAPLPSLGQFASATEVPAAEDKDDIPVPNDPLTITSNVENQAVSPEKRTDNTGGFREIAQDQQDDGSPRIPGALAFGAVSGSATKDISVLSQGSGFAPGTSGGNDSDDPFSAFESISSPTQPELPPLSTTMSSDSGPALAPPDEEDDFGDFTSSSIAVQPAAEVEEDFGDFASSSDVNYAQATAPPSQLLEQDFGPFGSAPVPTSSSEVAPAQGDNLFGAFDATSPQPAGDADAVSAGDGDFGAFDAVPTTVPPAPGDDLFGSFDAASPQPPTETDLVSAGDGDFGAFDAAPAAVPSATGDDMFGSFDAAPSQPATDTDPVFAGDDDFGAFDAAPAAVPSATGDNMFGSFDAAPSQPTTDTDPVSAGDDDFGAFDAAPAAVSSAMGDDMFGSFDAAPSQPATDTDPVSAGDDDFGAFDMGDDMFGSFDAAPSQPATDTDPVSAGDDDFGAFDAAPAAVPSATGDDMFGSFDAAPSQSASNADPVSAGEDDFGAFDAAPAALVPLSAGDQIRDLSAPLSETLLRKSGFVGGHADLGECFEVNIGLSSPLDPARKNRIDRCIQVLEIMSKVNHNHSSTYWEQVLKVIQEELVHGSAILVEARSLSAKEMSEVSKSLQSMIAGLREYMRVARSIVATIGDVLMLDPSALLTIDTMASTWCSLSILEIALEIESTWKDILRELNLMMPSFSRSADAPTIEGIRSGVSGDFPPGDLCELTFQALLAQNESTTKAQVSWNGKEFMACSANLLANRCPFYIASK
jgi:hypothetical protein